MGHDFSRIPLDKVCGSFGYNVVIYHCYMEGRPAAALEKIQQAAMEAFLEKGFPGASLRQIVKQAGTAAGAFSGYFSSKEARFDSLVKPHAAAPIGRFMEAQTSFAELPARKDT